MKRFMPRFMFAVCAVLAAALAVSCDLPSVGEGSFFNEAFYGLAAGDTGGLTGAGADSQITLAWNDAQNAEYYEVFYGTTPDVREISPVKATNTYLTVKHLANGAEYYAWVRAANGAGTGALAGPVRVTPREAVHAPDAPQAPRARALSGMVALDWLPVEGAVSYTVWQGTSDNSAEAQKRAENLDALAWTAESLINGTTYYFWISANNAAGEGGLSAVTAATPSEATEPPAAPAAPVLTAGSGQLTASWQSVAGTEHYEIWIATENNSSVAQKYGGDVRETSAVITALANGTRYYVWLKAKNIKGTSGLSPASNAVPTAFDSAPSAPASPVITLGSSSVSLSWQAVAGALSYEVWYGTTSESSSAQKYGSDISSSLSATITGLHNGTLYYVWLKAKNNIGASGFSASAQAKPIAAASTPVLVAGNVQLSVTWTAVASADSYDIFCGTGTNPPASPAHTAVADTSATLTGLTNGTTYSVWVRGRNSTGTGALSAAASAKPLGNMGAVTLTPGNSKLTANWTAVAGADSYAVYYNTGASMPANPSQTVATTQAVITGLTNGTTYYVWVKPLNNYGAGAASTAVSGKPAIVELYRGASFGTATQIDTLNLDTALSYIASNAMNGDNYFIVLNENQNCSPKVLDYSKTVDITLMADGGVERTVQLASNGSLFTINNGVTLTLQNNVTLKGRAANTASLVSVSSGGTLIMNGGTISGNTATFGGGVYVYNGTFIMSGGSISGNRANYGSGGVYVYNGTFTMSGGSISGNNASFAVTGNYYKGGGVYVDRGTFTKAATGGVITGYGNDTVTGNKVAYSSGVIQSNRGHAVYIGSSQRLEKTVPANKALDSSVAGADGGWTE
jgi:fibronectin type 3 domain-containing protein